jgi:probable rRNA maturation factor
MKLKIEFNNTSQESLRVGFLKETTKKTLELAGFDFLKKKTILVSFANVTEKEITSLNKKYRHKNRPTDVLSFSEYEKTSDIEKEKKEEIFLGEIVLCYADIKKYCQEKSIPLKEELTRVASHGILHLLGFRHGKKMFAIQNEVAKRITDQIGNKKSNFRA